MFLQQLSSPSIDFMIKTGLGLLTGNSQCHKVTAHHPAGLDNSIIIYV